MHGGFDSSVRLPFLEKFSPRGRALAEKALEQQDERRRKETASRAKKAEQVLEEFRGRVFGLLGAKKAAAFREALQQERSAFRASWDPPAGLTRDYTKARLASDRKIAQLARKLGANPKKLAQISDNFDRELRKVLSGVEGKVTPGFNVSKNFKKWVGMTPFHKFPLPWVFDLPDDDPNDPHRWFLFRPPFFGFLFHFSPVATSNFVVDHEHVLVPSVGLVGNKGIMDCVDAGDFDAASIVSESQIAFSFEPPTTGVVEVIIDAQCTIDSHDLEIEDEWGFSNAWTNQMSYLMMNVLHPNVPVSSMAQMTNMYREADGDDLSAHVELLTRGVHYSAHLFSSGPVPAGQSVVITAGARTLDIARANDMEVHSRSDCQWFISSVEVRIAP
jgi:hypothetical protein